MPTSRIRRFAPAIWLLLFVAFGSFLIPLAGFQNDEALFASGIYELWGIADVVRVFGVPVPLMLMTYLGTLKSWIYAAIFAVFEPNVWSVRLPVLLLGGLNLALLFRLLERAASPRVAWIACAILVTEPTFLMTTCFDWGPVTLQHLLATAGVLLLVIFVQTRENQYLAGAFLCFGLGMWDKALFIWMLSGMGIATLILFWRTIGSLLSWRRIVIAVFAFAFGALPLLVYNHRNQLATFRGNSGFSLTEAGGKAIVLKASLDGTVLFGFIPRFDAEPEFVRQPANAMERFSVWIQEHTNVERTWLPAALLASIALLPWLTFTPSARIAWFCVITGGLAWLQMAATNMAGGSAHHTVLLWPLPQIYLAVAVAELTRRLPKGAFAAALFALALFVTNTLVSNRHAALLIRNGAGPVWTDAIFGLSDYLAKVKAKEIYINDWGMMDALRMMRQGTLPLRIGSDPLSNPQLTPAQEKIVLDRLKPDAVFVSYTDDKQAFAGVNERMKRIADQAGYRRVDLAVIHDSHGRPTYEVFRYTKD